MFVTFHIDVLCWICLSNDLDVQAILPRQKSSTPSDPIKSCDESYRKANTPYHQIAPPPGTIDLEFKLWCAS